MRKRIYLSPPHLCGKELAYIHNAVESNWIAPIGPMVDAFEKEVCDYTGSHAAVALSSGTAALHLALLLTGVRPGDEVLCSTFTFAGSAFPITYLDAIPVFIDSEDRSWNMDPELLETAIKNRISKGRKPVAAIVVHLYGQSADMDAIIAICARYNVSVIEDAAESIGAYYREKHTGAFAPLGVLSFNGNKIITSSGGGMLLGSEPEVIHKARFLATQARDPGPHYQHSTIGYNYRMSNIVAAIGRAQLTAVTSRVKRRREIFQYYSENLEGIPGLGFMPEPDWSRSNRWLTCITVDPLLTGTTHEQIRLALEAENVESRPLWKPMHLQPVFKDAPAYISGISERLFASGLCLPSGTSMSDDELALVVACIRKVICS